jgi:hypothetical protein
MTKIQIAQYSIQQFELNTKLFAILFQKTPSHMVKWRLKEDQWNMLEIVGHLIDEEIEDFRLRTKMAIEKPGQTPHSIDPVGWVEDREYANQDFDKQTKLFLEERAKSLTWLQSLDLKTVPWKNGYEHPARGFLDAWFYFTNWLAHDHHHIRQINRLQYAFLREQVGKDLAYAGNHEVFK